MSEPQKEETNGTNPQKDDDNGTYLTEGLSIGMALCTIIGLLINGTTGMAMGIGIGMCLGIAIGSAIKKPKKDDDDKEE